MFSSLDDNLVNERKFSGPGQCLQQVLSVLKARCPPDDWFATGIVNSIYFDTPGLGAYWEKANGDNLKRKIRMRWYGADDSLPAEVPVFIEVKGRVGSARDKVRQEAKAPRELLLSSPFEDGTLTDFLAASSDSLGVPVSREWSPVCCISYHRRRYFDMPSMSRVSIDWNIESRRFNRVRFPWARPVALDSMVCEFKNRGGQPPEWAEYMLAAGLRFGSFSKYGECMERLISGEP